MVAASGRYGAGFAEMLLEEHPTSRTVCAAGARDSRVSTTHADVAGGVQLLELQRLLPQVEQVQIVEKIRAAALAAEEQDLVAVLR